MKRPVPLWLVVALCAVSLVSGLLIRPLLVSPATSNGASSPQSQWATSSTLTLPDGQVITAPAGHTIQYRKVTTTTPGTEEVHSKSSNKSQGVETDNADVAAKVEVNNVTANANENGAGSDGGGGKVFADVKSAAKSPGLWYIFAGIFAALALLAWIAPKVDPELKAFVMWWVPPLLAACAGVCLFVAIWIAASTWVMIAGGLAVLVVGGVFVYQHYQHAWEKAPAAPVPAAPSPTGATGPTGA